MKYHAGHDDLSEPPFSDFDPFGVRQLMSVVSFRSSANVNAREDTDKTRGSRSRMALRNKMKNSSLAPHRDYWERAGFGTTRYLDNKESVGSSDILWEEMEFDDDDSALFDPEVETASNTSGSFLNEAHTSRQCFETVQATREGHERRANRTDPSILDESIISLRLHRAHKNEPRAKAGMEKKHTSCENTTNAVTHEFLLVREKLNKVRGGQDERHDRNMASKAASFETLPSSSTDVTSPESFETDSCRSMEGSSSDVVAAAEGTKKSNSKETSCRSFVVSPTENDPLRAKYYRMLKVGLPMLAVIHACERDGVDPGFLQNDHETSKDPETRQDDHRRTRVHWNPLFSVGKNSIWALLDREAAELENLRIDQAEFSQLFEAKKEDSRQPDAKNRSGNISLQSPIEPEREKNGSIVLSALRRDPVDLAKDVNEMNDLNLDSEQIASLVQYIPCDKEKVALSTYLQGQVEIEPSRMSACQKWMIAISSVQDAKEKLRSMQFMADCPALLECLRSEANLLERACLQIKESSRLRKLLGIILSLGNRLNTAGEGRKNRAVAGIPLSALVELEQVKAYDGAKTSFLQYVVTIIQRNHPDMLPGFGTELDCVFPAERIQYDQWKEQIYTTEKHLESLKKIALNEARSQSNFEEEILLLRVTKPGMFVVQSLRILDDLKQKNEELALLFDDLNSYFAIPNHENSSQRTTSEIIATVAALVRSVERARKEGDKALMAKSPLSLKPHHRLGANKNSVAGPKLEQMLRESNLLYSAR